MHSDRQQQYRNPYLSEDRHEQQSYRSAYPDPQTAVSLYPIPSAVLFDLDDILHDPWYQDAAAVYSAAQH